MKLTPLKESRDLVRGDYVINAKNDTICVIEHIYKDNTGFRFHVIRGGWVGKYMYGNDYIICDEISRDIPCSEEWSLVDKESMSANEKLWYQ